MEAVFEVTYKQQPQMIVDVIVHGHVVADQVDAQRAITFAECLLLVPYVTSGDLADHIMGENAGKSCHNLGVPILKTSWLSLGNIQQYTPLIMILSDGYNSFILL